MFYLQLIPRYLLFHLISLYQQYLSPLKGFCCAHRARYGEESCSAYVKRILYEQDLLTAFKLTHQRFQACGQASLELARQKQQLPPQPSVLTLPPLRSQQRRYFLLVTVPAFLLGLSTPALAAGRVPRGCGWNVSRSGYYAYRTSQKSTDEENRQLMQGCCCGTMVLGAILSNYEEK